MLMFPMLSDGHMDMGSVWIGAGVLLPPSGMRINFPIMDNIIDSGIIGGVCQYPVHINTLGGDIQGTDHPTGIPIRVMV